MITVKSKGDFKKTRRFLRKARKMDPRLILQKYGEIGLQALEESTPKNTGLTARSWYYEITSEGHVYYLTYYNSNVQDGVNVAVILDLGHGTSTGGYVQGRNYVDPAVGPILDSIAESAWKEVTDA